MTPFLESHTECALVWHLCTQPLSQERTHVLSSHPHAGRTMTSEKEHSYAITKLFYHEHRWGARGSPSLDATKLSQVPGCGSREHGSRLRGAGAVSRGSPRGHPQRSHEHRSVQSQGKPVRRQCRAGALHLG